MKFATYFRACSYAMVACGTLTLTVTGGVGPALAAVFFLALVLAWNLEGTKWQLSERTGLIVVLLSLPLFYFDWRYLAGGGGPRERIGIGALAHLILFLSAVKLLQVKAERDWVFIYLISFFEVLLAAGLSISPMYLLGLGLYMLCALSTILAFEIKKSGSRVENPETRLLVSPESTLLRRRFKRAPRGRQGVARRLPLVGLVLLFLIGALALPLFLVMPRFGGTAWANNRAGVAGFTGFSDSVTLGAIGQLQKNNQVAFRVRVEQPATRRGADLRWRGVALDYFTGRGWRQSRPDKTLLRDNGNNLFQFGPIYDSANLTKQTFLLEPLDTPYLFGAGRVMALQASFTSIIRDSEDSMLAPHDADRASYVVYSDTREPAADELRRDDVAYGADYARYTQVPGRLDPRVKELAATVVRNAKAANRYDQARAIEKYLQSEYGYSLDLKVGQGGRDPLPDFLFNVRSGHCEYFATAMAVMLRTQGVATRVVNGFQTGEYNDAAGVFTVSQADAHSWVEVYFPQTGEWVTFDPTPAAGRTSYSGKGFQSFVGKYAEALQLLWIQYVVGYDKTEQQSLAGTVQTRTSSLIDSAAERMRALGDTLSHWWRSLTGAEMDETGAAARVNSVLLVVPGFILIMGLLWALRRFRRVKTVPDVAGPTVDFFERMMRILATAGFNRPAYQTPLEFAATVDLPEAQRVTEVYYRVRFGEHSLTPDESREIESWLENLETHTTLVASS